MLIGVSRKVNDMVRWAFNLAAALVGTVVIVGAAGAVWLIGLIVHRGKGHRR